MTATLDVERLRHDWKQIRDRVREHWNMLSDDDLVIHGGNVEQFLERLHKVTGAERSEVEHYLSGLMFGNLPGSRYAVEAREQLASRASLAARHVRQKPVSSFGTALAMGFVVGVLVGVVVENR